MIDQTKTISIATMVYIVLDLNVHKMQAHLAFLNISLGQKH